MPQLLEPSESLDGRFSSLLNLSGRQPAVIAEEETLTAARPKRRALVIEELPDKADASIATSKPRADAPDHAAADANLVPWFVLKTQLTVSQTSTGQRLKLFINVLKEREPKRSKLKKKWITMPQTDNDKSGQLVFYMAVLPDLIVANTMPRTEPLLHDLVLSSCKHFLGIMQFGEVHKETVSLPKMKVKGNLPSDADWLSLDEIASAYQSDPAAFSSTLQTAPIPAAPAKDQERAPSLPSASKPKIQDLTASAHVATKAAPGAPQHALQPLDPAVLAGPQPSQYTHMLVVPLPKIRIGLLPTGEPDIRHASWSLYYDSTSGTLKLLIPPVEDFIELDLASEDLRSVVRDGTLYVFCLPAMASLDA